MSTSGQPPAFRQRIDALVDVRRYDEAAKTAVDWLAAAPNSADPHAWLAWVLLKQAKWDESDGHAREAIGLAPDWHWPYRLLACAHFNRSRHEEAHAQMLEALRLWPDYADYHQFFSRICLALKRRDEALAAARRAVELDPEDAECRRWLLAVEYFEKSADADVLNHLLKLQGALALDPNNAEILDDLATLHQDELADFATAESLTAQALVASPENREYQAHLQQLRELKDPWYRWLMVTWHMRHIPRSGLVDLWSEGLLVGILMIVCFALPCVFWLGWTLLLLAAPGGTYVALVSAERWSLTTERPWLARALRRIGLWPRWLKRTLCVALAIGWWGLLIWALDIEPALFAVALISAVALSIAFTLYAFRKQRRRAALLKTLVTADTVDDVVRAELA